ncbi:MAG: hypothetical protein AB8B59_16505 [Maribacter sp.]
MKKSSLLLLLAALFFGAVTYYFMYFADGGADGLSSFVFIVLFGVLSACLFLAFLLSFFLRKGQSKTARNWIIGVVIALPILGILSITGVFSYFTYDYQNQWEVQVESDKSVLTTLRFKDDNFGVAFNHVSGNVSTYYNGTPIPTPITPRIGNGMLVMPIDDSNYLEPDFLIKLKNEEKVTLSEYTEGLNKELNLEIKFKKADVADFLNVLKNTEILMLGSDVPYQKREQLGKYLLPEKTGQSDLIYFFKQSEKSQTIWVLIVSSNTLSASATVEKMSTDDFANGNLWFHTLEFID